MGEAIKWLCKAAEAGCSKAALQISPCYLTGEGVPQDKTLAYAYLSFYCMAEDTDDENKILLQLLVDELTTAQRVQAYAKAKGLHEKARKLRGIN